MEDTVALKTITGRDMNPTVFVFTQSDSFTNQESKLLNNRMNTSIQFSISSYSQMGPGAQKKNLHLDSNKVSESFYSNE